jgi:hypothetical protein
MAREPDSRLIRGKALLDQVWHLKAENALLREALRRALGVDSSRIELGARVTVVHSRHPQVVPGEAGDVVARIEETPPPREILVVQFEDGSIGEFYPGELAVLGEEDVPAEARQKEE